MSAGVDAHNTPEPETHFHEEKTPKTTAVDCTPKIIADVDRKSRDFVGDNDVKQSPRESLSLLPICPVY